MTAVAAGKQGGKRNWGTAQHFEREIFTPKDIYAPPASDKDDELRSSEGLKLVKIREREMASSHPRRSVTRSLAAWCTHRGSVSGVIRTQKALAHLLPVPAHSGVHGRVWAAAAVAAAEQHTRAVAGRRGCSSGAEQQHAGSDDTPDDVRRLVKPMACTDIWVVALLFGLRGA